MRTSFFITLIAIAAAVAAAQQPNPRQQPGGSITAFAPDQHDLYDGHFIMSANRIYMVGGMNDPEGWDHIDNAAATVKPVAGTVDLDVNDLTNTGKFEARLKIPEGDLVLAIDRFHEFSPLAGKKGPAGEVNPAAQQIDFYIRSPQQNPNNKPNRQVFMHFFGMEVTWK